MSPLVRVEGAGHGSYTGLIQVPGAVVLGSNR
jgi:hypothetical protein